MSGFDRFTEPDVARAIDRVRRELRGPVAMRGPVLEVYLPTAGAAVPIAHGLGAIPAGYECWFAVGGSVLAIDVTGWTPDVAYLAATADHTRVRVSFVVFREGVTRG